MAKPRVWYDEASFVQALRADLQTSHKCITLLHRYWQGAVPGFLAVPFLDSGRLSRVGIVLIRIQRSNGHRLVLITGLENSDPALKHAYEFSRRMYGPIPIRANPVPFNPRRIRGSTIFRALEDLADPAELSEWAELKIE